MNNKRKIFIGSRRSNLAKKQTAIALKILKKEVPNNFHIKHILSTGDKVSFREFKNNGGKGLFTKNIDNLLINKKIDLAVHSAKDLPGILDKRLIIGAYLPREDVRDVLVTKNKNIKNLLDLEGKVIFGSSSPRRIYYLKNLFPLARIKNLRGNIESRIKKVLENKIDYILLANAGIKRLNLKFKNINIIKISTETILPAPGQGAIAILCRKNDEDMIKVCNKIDSLNTRILVSSERAFMREIDGDCFTPLAALAKIKGTRFEITARLFSKNGKYFSEHKEISDINKAIKAGKICAKKILKDLEKKIV